MPALTELTKRLRPGQVYRRKDLTRWSTSVDRHLHALVADGRLENISGGLYMAPRKTQFGWAPATSEKLVETFLGDDRFLMVSPIAHNRLGVGTTRLHSEPVVYNRKRHGRFYDFRMRSTVPAKLTQEVLPRALERARSMDRKKLAKAVRAFGSARVERLLAPVLTCSDLELC